jgi:hypothetical protein
VQLCSQSYLQVTSEAMYHQAFITGLPPIPSLCCIQPPFWQAPGARAACRGADPVDVVMVFSTFANYQSLFQPGSQHVAEAVVLLYKSCVQLALDMCNGYECQARTLLLLLLLRRALKGARLLVASRTRQASHAALFANARRTMQSRARDVLPEHVL